MPEIPANPDMQTTRPKDTDPQSDSSGPGLSRVGQFSWRPRIRDVAIILVLFLANRAILVTVGARAWRAQVPECSHAQPRQVCYPWRHANAAGARYELDPNLYLDQWIRWDAWQYEEIARQGYWYNRYEKPRPYGTVACFPLYPLVVRAVGFLLGGRYLIAGLIVSNLAAIASFILLFQWAMWWGGRRAAWVAVSAAITFPAGIFWSALYPQSLFFALSIAACLLALTGRIAWAGVVGAAVTATRLEGIVIMPALLALHLYRRKGRIGPETLWLAIVPLGLLMYMAYLDFRWDDPLLFLKVHTLFGRRAANPLATLLHPWTTPGGLRDFRVLLTYMTGALLILGHAARLPWPVCLYGWLLFLVPLSTGVYESSYRVHLVNIPIYLALGLGLSGRWRPVAWLIIAGFAAAQMVLMYAWVAGYRIT